MSRSWSPSGRLPPAPSSSVTPYLTRVVSRRRLLGYRRDPVRWRDGGRRPSPPSFLTFAAPEHRCRASAARRSIRSATACWPSSSRPSGAASRSAPTSPAGTWDGRRGAHRRPAHRRDRLAWRVDRVRVAGHRRRIAILLFVRERGTDRAAALASGTVREAFGRILRDRDLRWLYLTSALGGGGRGLGVVNLFALVYMTQVLGLDEETSGLMYGALIVFSVPMPLIAGWLSDRIGRKPLIIGVYLGGAVGVHRLPGGWVVAGLAVGRHRADGPVHVRREPATPGAARRHRAAIDPRRVVRDLLRDGVRGRVAVARPSTARSSARSARRRACRSCSG